MQIYTVSCDDQLKIHAHPHARKNTNTHRVCFVFYSSSATAGWFWAGDLWVVWGEMRHFWCYAAWPRQQARLINRAECSMLFDAPNCQHHVSGKMNAMRIYTEIMCVRWFFCLRLPLACFWAGGFAYGIFACLPLLRECRVFHLICVTANCAFPHSYRLHSARSTKHINSHHRQL